MKNTMKRLVCMSLVMTMVFMLATPISKASAASYTTGMKGNQAMVLTVKTDKKSSTLTISQTKGTVGYLYALTGQATQNTYGKFFVYVVDTSGKEKPVTYDCVLKGSLSIKLSANKTYRITISASAWFTTVQAMDKAGVFKWSYMKIVYGRITASDAYWVKVPEMTVKIPNILSMSVVQKTKAPQQ